MGEANLSGPLLVERGVFSPESVHYFDDFIVGTVALPAAAIAGYPWVTLITGAAPPTVASGTDAAGGTVVMSLTATAEAQQAGWSHNNQRNFDISLGAIFYARCTITTLPTLLGKLFIGLAADNNANPDSITHSAWIAVAASGVITAEIDDNVTDTVATSGLAVVAGDRLAVKIDFEQIGNVKFYIAINPTRGQPINWTRVGQTTTFAYAGTGANAILQPFFSAAKASGAGLGVLTADSVAIAHLR